MVTLVGFFAFPCSAQTPSNNSLYSFLYFLRVLNIPPLHSDVLTGKQEKNYSLQDLRMEATKLGLLMQVKPLTLAELYQHGGCALLHVKNPDRYVTLLSIGKRYALIHEDQLDTVVNTDSLASRYLKEALVANYDPTIRTAAQLNDAVCVIKNTAVGQAAIGKITITNRGQQPLKIEVGETSCGCTSAKLSSKLLLPRESAILTIEIQADTWKSRTESVTIRTSDPLWPRIMVAQWLQMPNVVPNPEKLVIKACEGHTESRLMTLWLPEAASISRISVRHPFIKAKVLGIESVEDGKEQRIEVTISANAPPGAFADEVIFYLKDADIPQLKVPMEGFIQSDIILTPPQIFLGFVAAGSVMKKRTVAQSQSDHLFAIKSIQNKNPSIKVQVEIGKMAMRQEIILDINVVGEVGTVIRDQVQILLSNNQKLTINVAGMIASKDKILVPQSDK